MPVRVLYIVPVLFLLPAPVHAQPPRAEPPKTVPFTADGTVQAVAMGRIQMLTNTNQYWIIFIDSKTSVQVTGVAQPDVLRVGTFIRFTTAVDKRGKASGKVGALTIFTPSAPNTVGAWPQTTPASYTVAGQIQRVRGGKLTVGFGRSNIEIELAEKPTVAVDFADYTVAKRGDAISITSGKMFPGRLGFAQASQLTIELAKPLTFAKRKPGNPKKGVRPPGRVNVADPK